MRIPDRLGAFANGCSLKTRQTKPEQSNPPGSSLPKSSCGFSEVPPQTYGEPTKRSARLSTICCQGVRLGSENDSDLVRIASTSELWIERSSRERVGSFGAGHGLRELELELLLIAQVVDAKPEHARDGLGPEPLRRLEAGVERREPKLPRGRAEADGADEARVELAHGDWPIGIRGHRHRGAERRQDDGEVGPGERVFRVELADARRHQARRDHGPDLRRGPGGRRLLRGRHGARVADSHGEGDSGAGEEREAAHSLAIGPCSGGP